MPNGLAGSNKVLEYIAQHISKETYANIMDRYHPCYKAYEIPEINRRITLLEYDQVVEYATKLGLNTQIITD